MHLNINAINAGHDGYSLIDRVFIHLDCQGNHVEPRLDCIVSSYLFSALVRSFDSLGGSSERSAHRVTGYFVNNTKSKFPRPCILFGMFSFVSLAAQNYSSFHLPLPNIFMRVESMIRSV